MKAETVCFTGHRVVANADLLVLEQRLDKTVEQLVNRGITRFLDGGAIGFDTLASIAVLKRREADRRIKLIIVQPCGDQDAKWRTEDKHIYRRLLIAADEVICLSDKYYDGCMLDRNKYLVDHSAICVAYLKRNRSGTRQTVLLARAMGLEIINLAE